MNPNSASIMFPSGKCITVDYFKGFSSVYFLSHFHMDHVIGLKDIQHQCKIYCSSITKQLVLADQSFKAAHQMLAELPVNSPRSVAELTDLSVTLIPAGHCLGSVMFLFEETRDSGARYVALHTGDFRIPTEPEALRGVAAFHRDGGVIPLDNIVLDTTFFTEHCSRLPTRDESIGEICNLVGDCMDRRSASGQKSATSGGCCQGVVLVAKARFSYECVYQSLAETFNTKVHISEQGLRCYGQLANDLSFFSTNPDGCFVHLDGCGCDTRRMLTICLSTMYFDKTAGFTQTVVWPGERTARVLFSFHPSMREVVSLVDYLKPCAVRALVTPCDDTEASVQARLEATLRAGATAKEPDDHGVVSLTSLKRRRSDFSVVANCGGVGDVFELEGSDSDDSLCAVPTGLEAKWARMS